MTGEMVDGLVKFIRKILICFVQVGKNEGAGASC